MKIKFLSLLLLLLLSTKSVTSRLLSEEPAEEAGEEAGEEGSEGAEDDEEFSMEEDETPSELGNMENNENKREIIVRPQDIDISLKQKAFHDTILNLNAESNIRIKIKVHNSQFLPLFN